MNLDVLGYECFVMENRPSRHGRNGRNQQLETCLQNSQITDTGDNIHQLSEKSEESVLVFDEPSHPIELLKGLNSLRLEGQFCDVTLVVDDMKLQAHRNVLSSFSPYFRAMFTGSLLESNQQFIHLNGVESEMIQLLVDFAYTNRIVINKSNVQNLLSAANLLEILPVRDACCKFMEEHMDASNCIGIHCFAEAHACIDLQDKAQAFLLKHFSDVIGNEEFLSLPQHKLIQFIQNDDLGIEKEEDVFEAVLEWLNHADSRKSSFYEVLEYIRLPLLSPYSLYDFVEGNSFINGCPKCKALVEEAKKYHLLLDRRNELKTTRTTVRKAALFQQVIVLVGGEDDRVVLRSVDSFNPFNSAWKALCCLPFALSKHGVIASGDNYLYLAGGEYPDGSASKSVLRYDPMFDKWLELPNMIETRSELGLALLDGYIYAVGGWEGKARLDSVERYSIKNNSWDFIPPLKVAVTSPAVVAHEGLLYVTGGAILDEGDGIELVQMFNPRKNCWTELQSMLIPRSGSAACVVDHKIYVIGGWHASTDNTDKVEKYDISTNTWEFCAPLSEKRYRPGVSVIDKNIYIFGGEEGWDRYHDTIECYDTTQDKWSQVGEIPTSRSWLSCATIQVKKE